MQLTESAHHRGLAAYYRGAGEEATADLCQQYADLVDAYESAEGADKKKLGEELRALRQTWREVRDVFGSSNAEPGGVAVKAPVVAAGVEVN